MKEIQLSLGKVAIVDDEDYEWLSQWKWFYCKGRAVRKNQINLVRKHVSMHRLIMGNPQGKEIDHINGNSLDNRRSNLRICTHAENMMNMGISVNNTSGYKGVYWNKERKKWQVQISYKDNMKYVGRFETIQEAVKAYNNKAVELYGKFARLNEIKS